jgi:DNA-binding transcriptional ArsR family regulator
LVNRRDRESEIFAALADPTRRRILERLSGSRECAVTALARPFRMSLPAISRHLRVLERARLIQRERHGREHLIRSNVAGLQSARKWILQYAMQWDSNLDALDALLKNDTAISGRKGNKL